MVGSVAIVGGSIGGTAAAIELARIRFDVEIFERSAATLVDRGAGIGLPVPFLATMEERGLIDPSVPRFYASKRRFVVRSGASGQRTLWEQPIAFGMTSWRALYRELRRRVPDERFHSGHEVVGIEDAANGHVAIETTHGKRGPFDFVVAADGYESPTRRQLFPEARLSYAGYVLWRGLLDERLVPDVALFHDALTFAVYRGGHGPFYFVPGREGEVEVGRRRLNWGIYAAIDPPPAPVAPGGLSREQLDRVRSLAAELGARCEEIVLATDAQFVQPIYDLRVPSYRRGRVCLLGDAATVARPHTAGGVPKAVHDAISLAAALRAHPTIDEALSAWDRERTAAGHDLVTLGEALGRAVVTDVPDWSVMDAAGTEAWWESAMKGRTWYPVADVKTAHARATDGHGGN